MSNDFETGVYIEPKGDAPKPKTDGGTCVLSVVINIVGGLSILAGAILGGVASGKYSTEDLAPVYFIGGILSGIFNFALAVIVDACDKYRKAHKG